MEPCSTYKPWHNKKTGKTYLLPDDGKCLHYYFYFIDEDLGLGYVRVPTWLPCRLQSLLQRAQLAGQRVAQAQDRIPIARQCVRAKLPTGSGRNRSSTGWRSKRLHHRLDECARRFCPIHRDFGVAYHWSVDQCEYATDIVFRRQSDLAGHL